MKNKLAGRQDFAGRCRYRSWDFKKGSTEKPVHTGFKTKRRKKKEKCEASQTYANMHEEACTDRKKKKKNRCDSHGKPRELKKAEKLPVEPAYEDTL